MDERGEGIMPHDIFIIYSHEPKIIADDVLRNFYMCGNYRDVVLSLIVIREN